MTLLEESYEDFVFVSKTFVPDGQGGTKPAWVEGETTFKASADFNISNLQEIANKLTEKVTCTITTSKAITLEPMDVIKRVSDGQYFRITTNGKNKKTPESASLDMRQSVAELWTLPSGE